MIKEEIHLPAIEIIFHCEYNGQNIIRTTNAEGEIYWSEFGDRYHLDDDNITKQLEEYFQEWKLTNFEVERFLQ